MNPHFLGTAGVYQGNSADGRASPGEEDRISCEIDTYIMICIPDILYLSPLTAVGLAVIVVIVQYFIFVIVDKENFEFILLQAGKKLNKICVLKLFMNIIFSIYQ